MRIAGHIPHPVFKISIFTTETHYSILFQAGPMEQSYKVSKEKVNGIEGVKRFVDQELSDQVHDIFNSMYVQLKAAEERYEKKN